MSALRLGLGCVSLGTDPKQSVVEQVRLVRGAIDLGFSVFDTADAYGGGASEHVLGRALRGRRDDVVIATKAGFAFRARSPLEQWARRRVKPAVGALRSLRSANTGSGGPAFGSNAYSQQDFSPMYLRVAVHASLRRLGTDRIDVFQLHGPDRYIPGVVESLADLVTAGDIVRVGVGADSVDAAAAWKGVDGVSVLQVPFGVLDPDAARQFDPASNRAAQDVWARGVLGGGLLSRSDLGPGGPASHPQQPRVEAVRRLASSAGIDVYEFALRFVLAHSDRFSTVLVGSTSLEHLRRNADVLAGAPLDPELVAEVIRLAEASRVTDDG